MTMVMNPTHTEEVLRSDRYRLASHGSGREARSILDIAGRQVGGTNFALIAGPCTVESRSQTLDTARIVRDAGATHVPRRRLQAAHLALRLPGPGPGGPAAAGRGQGADRAADRHRGHGRARPRRGARGRRRHPDRRPQHAELQPAVGDRPLRAPGAAQARAVEHARGAAAGRRVHPQGGQRFGHPLRARDPHLRDRLPLHARPDGHPGAQGDDPPAGDRRPEPRRRPARPGAADVAGRRGRRCRRDHRRGPPESRRGHLRRAPAARRPPSSPATRPGRRRGGAGRQGTRAVGSTALEQLASFLRARRDAA